MMAKAVKCPVYGRSEEQLKVYCPKEKRKVPVWWCLGSYNREVNI